jgi:hypothetical protein
MANPDLDILGTGRYNFFTSRVSPSGKAVPSQGTIRGFESHHPLTILYSDNLLGPGGLILGTGIAAFISRLTLNLGGNIFWPAFKRLSLGWQKIIHLQTCTRNPEY